MCREAVYIATRIKWLELGSTVLFIVNLFLCGLNILATSPGDAVV